MAPTYNGWEDTPEDEREALEQWEAVIDPPHRGGRKSRASTAIVLDGSFGPG
jgi:hypothetical protein